MVTADRQRVLAELYRPDPDVAVLPERDEALAAAEQVRAGGIERLRGNKIDDRRSVCSDRLRQRVVVREYDVDLQRAAAKVTRRKAASPLIDRVVV